MTKKIAAEFSECVPKRKALRSFSKRLRKARADYINKQDGNSNLLDSRTDVRDLFKSLIKELSVLRKIDGLITGTNEVLRLLEKEKLAVVFMSKDKASISIKTSVIKICGQAGVPFVWLEDNDKHILGPQFPKSITYGIKKESLATLENLNSILLELLAKRSIKENENDAVSSTDISSNEMKLPSEEERTNQEVLDATTFYHTHERHISKISNSKETGFLSLNKFSTDDRETDFLDYDSMACSGILSVK